MSVVRDLCKVLTQVTPSDPVVVEDFKKTILLTAPTGKAARLLGVKAKLPSATIHSVLMSWRHFLTVNLPLCTRSPSLPDLIFQFVK